MRGRQYNVTEKFSHNEFILISSNRIPLGNESKKSHTDYPISEADGMKYTTT